MNWLKNIKVEILIARFIRRLKKLVNRCNKYELMKKDLYVVLGSIISGVAIAFIINTLSPGSRHQQCGDSRDDPSISHTGARV